MTQTVPKHLEQGSSLFNAYKNTRNLSQRLVQDLSDADATVQSMEDASPAKWHLGHTTWFFETMILANCLKNFQAFDEDFAYLFNSYYETLGARHPRPKRGMLTRPSLDHVLAYRVFVDEKIDGLFKDHLLDEEMLKLVELGIHHEQQHQELLLSDILHLFAQTPLKPAFAPPQPLVYEGDLRSDPQWISFDGGLYEFGHETAQNEFAYDCEEPRHKVWLEDFQIANRLVTNSEWQYFIENAGYETATLWLSDGWARAQEENWQAPLYWEKRDNQWWSMTLRGFQPIDPDAPVCHISLYEADAYARFAGARLPSEYEWERAANAQRIQGNLLDLERLRPKTNYSLDLCQLYGDVWEWTASSFAPYPGFQTAKGAVGEYNGKFMNGQYVLRGGSCITPPGHMRATYRNFFHPDKRWQFSGLRLARSV